MNFIHYNKIAIIIFFNVSLTIFNVNSGEFKCSCKDSKTTDSSKGNSDVKGKSPITQPKPILDEENKEENKEENPGEGEINDNTLYIKSDAITLNREKLQEEKGEWGKNVVNKNYIDKVKIYNCKENAFKLEYKIDNEFENKPYIIAIVEVEYDNGNEYYIVSSLNYSNNKGGLFEECGLIIKIKILESKNVTDMNRMFYKCSTLTNIDLSNLDTSDVTDMFGMFNGCTCLESLDLSSFNTENVTDMSNMFFGCYNLINLDLSNFNTEKVNNIDGMFSKCIKLKNVITNNEMIKNLLKPDNYNK